MKVISVTFLLLAAFLSTNTYAGTPDSILSKLQLAQLHFERLRDSGLLVYSVEINKKRYQERLDDLDQARKIMLKDNLEANDLKAAHTLSSKAFIGIRGLKTAGSIGYIKKEARILYTQGITTLKDAVVELYELTTANRKRKRFQTLYSLDN